MKLTKAQRDELDEAVLGVLASRGPGPTYWIRNVLDWPGQPWHARGLKTSDVLRACRRAEAAGRVEDHEGSYYAVMKSWRITPAGRAEGDGT